MSPNTVNAVVCRQWLEDWDQYPFPADNQRRKPPSVIYVFSMSARLLRKLSGVYVRRREGGDATGIQRSHDKERSRRIADYVKTGYPFGDLSSKQKTDQANATLKKPGWLPTAIVANIIPANDERRGKRVDYKDLVKVAHTANGTASITLPSESTSRDWSPTALPPIEIIDGQHRLFAFEDSADLPDDFELPVVAFEGLDIGWQAYLFWSINVSPKKINPSHAYDLFPLLRTQDWLANASAVHVYREARAQELTELLFRHHHSPWRHRINMLGERKTGWVSQAGWVQTLYNSFLNPGLAARSRKGLFAANLSATRGPLEWCRAQQAAFLIFLWRVLENAVSTCDEPWATVLRADQTTEFDIPDRRDPPFAGSNTLLNQEQGVRGFCLAINDLLFESAERLKLSEWVQGAVSIDDTQDEDISDCLASLEKQFCAASIRQTIEALATFDWRSSDAPELSENQRLQRASYRGTSGYSRVRLDLLQHIGQSGSPLAQIAQQLSNDR